MHETSIARAAEIIAGQQGSAGYCTLALIDLDSYPTAATISPAGSEGIRWIAFGTGTESNWAKRIRGCGRASVCFNGPGHNITLVGDIHILTDPETKKKMWYDGMGMYFTGPLDPGFCVLRFETRRYSIMISEQEGVVRGAL